MLLHASCAVRDEIGVLIRGRSGSGKSSLLLRLLGQGFELVADDCVLVEDGMARAPEALRGLIEVRGMGVYRRQYRSSARVRLVVESGRSGERVAARRLCRDLGQPIIELDLLATVSCDTIGLAVACLTGKVDQIVGPI